jgi:hypothetical protein
MIRLVRSIAVMTFVVGCSGTQAPKVAPYQQRITSDLDLLFVMDNSSSTSDLQSVLVTNFPKFVATLDALPNGRPNLHIGVVTSTVDIGVAGFGPGCPSPDPLDNGLLVNAPRVAAGCSGPAGRYISDVRDGTGARTVNYSGTLDATFSCIAAVGSIGCGFEAPLEAMKRALDGTRLENAGFLRPTADVGVVILTDEDDCSVADPALFSLDPATAGPGDFRCQPLFAYDCDPAISATQPGTYTNCKVKTGSYLHDPAEYHDFLTALAGDGNVFVSVIGGDPSTTIQTIDVSTPFAPSLALGPSCSMTINGNAASAKPGDRLNDLVSRLGGQGMYATVCQSDYSTTLVQIAQFVAQAESPCLRGAIDIKDTDPANPGLQPACTVTTAGTTLPACTMIDDATPDPSQTGCA